MPIYKYTALNSKGKEEKGIVDAKSPAGARQQLKHKGLYLKSIEEDREKQEKELLPFLAKFVYRIPRRSIALFVRQLGTLLSAGLPLDRSLTNIIDQVENINFKKKLIQMRTDIVEGASLSEAMKKHSDVFPPIYYHLMSVGEKMGQYETTLIRLAELEDSNIRLQDKIVTALIYPLFMMILLAFIILFLLGVVVPQIQQLFVQLDQQLPLITRFVIGVSDIISSWKILFPITFIAMGYYFFQNWVSEVEGRKKYEQFILTRPIFGSFLRKVLLSRFSRNLAVLLKNRVSMVQSFHILSGLVQNKTFESEILLASDRIKEGSKITDAFRDSMIINPMVMGMISAGEASDSVPEMVEKIADIMDEEVNSGATRLTNMLEPILMLITAGMIILIMIAILLPVYDLVNRLQNF